MLLLLSNFNFHSNSNPCILLSSLKNNCRIEASNVGSNIFKLIPLDLFRFVIYQQGRRKGGVGEGRRPSCLFLRETRGSEVPFLNCFILILAIVFHPENRTEGTLCSKLIEIHLIALLPYQYKTST